MWGVKEKLHSFLTCTLNSFTHRLLYPEDRVRGPTDGLTLDYLVLPRIEPRVVV
jgi:hypothetical protein